MGLETKSEPEQNKSNIRQTTDHDLAPTRSESNNTTAARQVVLKEMCKMPVLVSTKAADLMQVTLQENVDRIHAYITVKSNIDVYLRRSFYITIANFYKANVYVPKQKRLLGSRLRLKR